MANIDWLKIKHALMSHEWIALAVIVWLVCIALYCILQVWFAYSWTARWRGAALAPLVVAAAFVVFLFIGQSYDPDVFGPQASALENLILAMLFLSPIGSVYLAITGILHRAHGKPGSA